MTFKISPSSMKLIEECPRCFYQQIVNKISRPSVPFPSLPSGVDKMLKERFDRFMQKGQLPPELKKHKVNAKLFNIQFLISALL